MKQTQKHDESKKKLLNITIPPAPPKHIYPIPNEELEKIKEFNLEKLIFSFRLFDRENEAFNLGEVCRVSDRWHLSFLDVLKEISNITRNELFSLRQHYDAHQNDWNKLKVEHTFSTDFLQQVECMQFRISKSKGRVHGFIIGNIFYIVWLDPHHNMIPADKYGGIKFYERPEACHELLNKKIIELEFENKDLKANIDEVEQVGKIYIEENIILKNENQYLANRIDELENKKLEKERVKELNKQKYKKKLDRREKRKK